MSKKDEQKENVPKNTKNNPFVRLWRKIKWSVHRIWRMMRSRAEQITHAKGKRLATLICAGVFFVLFIAIYISLGRMIGAFIEDSSAFREWIDGFGVKSVFVFLALRLLQTVFKIIPGTALEIAGGFVYGTWEGFLWCMIGSVIGSIVMMFLGRKFGMKLVGLFIDPELIHSSSVKRSKKSLIGSIILYALPGAPKDMFTWVASITSAKPITFLIVTTIARMPSVLVATWCGSEFMDGNTGLSIGIFVAMILLTLIGWLVSKFLESGKKKRAAKKGVLAIPETEQVLEGEIQPQAADRKQELSPPDDGETNAESEDEPNKTKKKTAKGRKKHTKM